MKLRRPFVALGLAVATLSSTGCLEWFGMEQGMVVIEQAVQIQTLPCANTVGNNALGRGVLDVGDRSRSYTVGLQVLSNLPTTLNTQILTQGRTRDPQYPNYGNTDSNTVMFSEVDVYFTGGNDIDQPVATLPSNPGGPQRLPISGIVFNQQQNIGNKSLLIGTALTSGNVDTILGDADLNSALDAGEVVEVVAHMRLRGETSGGSSLKSSEFAFPISICKGCLIPTCDLGEELTVPQCAIPGQDVALVCETP